MPALELHLRDDAVAVLRIDQPDSKANVLTRDLWLELEEAVNSLRDRPNVRGLMLTSAKPGIFIAGADLHLLRNAAGPNDPAVREFIDLGNRVLFALDTLPFPTCAAIDGAALGGGLEVALACDVRICGTHPKVRFGMPETRLGLIPGWGGTQRLPRLIGTTVAAQMLLSGKSIDAAQAGRIGLTFGPVDSGELLRLAVLAVLTPVEPACETPTEIPAASPDASVAEREVLRVMREGASLPLPDAVRLETDAFMMLAGAEESRHRIAAFFATRHR